MRENKAFFQTDLTVDLELDLYSMIVPSSMWSNEAERHDQANAGILQ
jgi:hypothetical protein